ncbi:hypothetical protein HK096_007051, partial [Nowakowskiella sp. JEL0078]
MYFAIGWRTLGPIRNTLYIIVIRDFLVRFLPFYILLWLGFTIAIYTQMSFIVNKPVYNNQIMYNFNSNVIQNVTSNGTFIVTGNLSSSSSIDNSNWGSFSTALTKVLGYQDGGPEFDSFQGETYVFILYAVFYFLQTYLVINTLIAILNNTYNEINVESDRLWVLQWAGLILEMDYKLGKSKLSYYMEKIGFLTYDFDENLIEEMDKSEPGSTTVNIPNFGRLYYVNGELDSRGKNDKKNDKKTKKSPIATSLAEAGSSVRSWLHSHVPLVSQKSQETQKETQKENVTPFKRQIFIEFEKDIKFPTKLITDI